MKKKKKKKKKKNHMATKRQQRRQTSAQTAESKLKLEKSTTMKKNKMSPNQFMNCATVDNRGTIERKKNAKTKRKIPNFNK
jgi:hypothetical protein